MIKLTNLFKAFTVALIISISINACYKKEISSTPSKVYASVTDSDIKTCINMVFPSEQISLLKTNAEKRKKVIENLQDTFAIASAALDVGLEHTPEFENHLSAGLNRLLATEFSERFASHKISDEVISSYANSHKSDFEQELKFLNYQPSKAEDIDKAKSKWSELQIRADLGRQKGIDKEAGFQSKSRLLRADILANMIFKKAEEQYKVKDSDIMDYYKRHPEASPDNIKNRMYTLIMRLKGGANFDQIANEVNEDDTKGKGGDLGWFSAGTMHFELERVAFSLQPSLFCTDPVETQYGYHIIALIGRRKLPATGKTEIHAKHIFISTKKAMEALSKQAKENIERDIKAIKSKHLVQAPLDFTVN